MISLIDLFIGQFIISFQEMKEEVINFRNGINSSSGNISCVFVVTSSHGRRDVIIGADKKTLAVKDIIEPFGDELCPKTKGKPKVFIIDACRGSKFKCSYLVSNTKAQHSPTVPLQVRMLEQTSFQLTLPVV